MTLGINMATSAFHWGEKMSGSSNIQHVNWITQKSLFKHACQESEKLPKLKLCQKNIYM